VWPASIDLNGGSMPHSFFRIDINSKLLRLYGVTVSLRTLRSDENGNFGETHIDVSMPRLRPQL
jgi:hypothetical protein